MATSAFTSFLPCGSSGAGGLDLPLGWSRPMTSRNPHSRASGRVAADCCSAVHVAPAPARLFSRTAGLSRPHCPLTRYPMVKAATVARAPEPSQRPYCPLNQWGGGPRPPPALALQESLVCTTMRTDDNLLEGRRRSIYNLEGWEGKDCPDEMNDAEDFSYTRHTTVNDKYRKETEPECMTTGGSQTLSAWNTVDGWSLTPVTQHCEGSTDRSSMTEECAAAVLTCSSEVIQHERRHHMKVRTYPHSTLPRNSTHLTIASRDLTVGISPSSAVTADLDVEEDDVEEEGEEIAGTPYADPKIKNVILPTSEEISPVKTTTPSPLPPTSSFPPGPSEDSPGRSRWSSSADWHRVENLVAAFVSQENQEQRFGGKSSEHLPARARLVSRVPIAPVVPSNYAYAMGTQTKGDTPKNRQERLIRRLDDAIWRVSRFVYRYLLSGMTLKASHETLKLHEKFFARPSYCTIRPRFIAVVTPLTVFSIKKVKKRFEIPRFSEVFQFIRRIVFKAALSCECIIISLIYIEKVMCTANVFLKEYNWRPIVIASLLLASKVWEDLSSWNVEFSEICPEFPLKGINKLERVFCGLMDFMLHIEGELYAKYYHCLKALGMPPWTKPDSPSCAKIPTSIAECRASSGTRRVPVISRSTRDWTSYLPPPAAVPMRMNRRVEDRQKSLASSTTSALLGSPKNSTAVHFIRRAAPSQLPAIPSAVSLIGSDEDTSTDSSPQLLPVSSPPFRPVSTRAGEDLRAFPSPPEGRPSSENFRIRFVMKQLCSKPVADVIEDPLVTGVDEKAWTSSSLLPFNTIKKIRTSSSLLTRGQNIRLSAATPNLSYLRLPIAFPLPSMTSLRFPSFAPPLLPTPLLQTPREEMTAVLNRKILITMDAPPCSRRKETPPDPKCLRLPARWPGSGPSRFSRRRYLVKKFTTATSVREAAEQEDRKENFTTQVEKSSHFRFERTLTVGCANELSITTRMLSFLHT